MRPLSKRVCEGVFREYLRASGAPVRISFRYIPDNDDFFMRVRTDEGCRRRFVVEVTPAARAFPLETYRERAAHEFSHVLTWFVEDVKAVYQAHVAPDILAALDAAAENIEESGADDLAAVLVRLMPGR